MIKHLVLATVAVASLASAAQASAPTREEGRILSECAYQLDFNLDEIDFEEVGHYPEHKVIFADVIEQSGPYGRFLGWIECHYDNGGRTITEAHKGLY